MRQPIRFNFRYGILIGALLSTAMLLVGCADGPRVRPQAISHSDAKGIMVVPHTTGPVLIDGKLDEPIWLQAKRYPLSPMSSSRLAEPGWISMAWDDQYLYLAAEFTDSDVVAEGDRDGQRHFALGDVCELFLKPEQDVGYWELYVTPKGHQSILYYPSRGRHLPSCLASGYSPLKVAAQISGTLNNYHDKDHGWSAEMAVPWSVLREYYPHAGPDLQWRMLTGRYNYSVYLSNAELSSFPRISSANFHLTEEYVKLRLKPK